MPTAENNLKEIFAGENQVNRKYVALAGRFCQRGPANSHDCGGRNHTCARTPSRIERDRIRSGQSPGCVAGEDHEYREMYPPMLEQDAIENHKAKRMFGYAVKAEEVHSRLYRMALEAVTQGKDLGETNFYLCPVCGHIELGKPPESCPVCNAKGSKYIQV